MVPDIHAKFHNQPFVMRRAIWRHVFGQTHSHTQTLFLNLIGSLGHISAIRLLAEKAREFRKDRALFIAFIDLKAAFYLVDRDCLWHILHSIGIPPKIVRVLERLYTDTSSCVRINNTPTGSPSPAELDKAVWLPLICSTASLTTLWKMSVPWCQESS